MDEREQPETGQAGDPTAPFVPSEHGAPIDLPGYEVKRLLGRGAYGTVWLAVDRNTGREVAIKAFAARAEQRSMLSQEVEKLVVLSADRYIVQLLEVGWEAETPYYVMEYLHEGSLQERLRAVGRLSVDEAVDIFREVAIGLVHAHGRGVLHCDIKPANVLLDQDGRPRLADFGQARLVNERRASLGTLFYMAPEQADLDALPDVRWDVYGLGALLYAMLVGTPPYENEKAIHTIRTSVDEQLTSYRDYLLRDAPPLAHQNVAGVDRALATIIERCVAVDPDERFPNAQAVLDALDERESRRARRPLILLGMVAPALLILVTGLAALGALRTALEQSDAALTARALESNLYAARYVAKATSDELARRARSIERLGRDPAFQALIVKLYADVEVDEIRRRLSDPSFDPSLAEPLRARFREHPARLALQARLDALMQDPNEPAVASWFVTDASGLQLARARASPTIGLNYAWRTYFHGGPEDEDESWRPAPEEHLRQTRLSAVFQSQASGQWIIAISTPVVGAEDGRFLGIVALSVEIGRFVWLGGSASQRAVLVDWRDGSGNKGLILQHPHFDRLREDDTTRLGRYTVPEDGMPSVGGAGGQRSKSAYQDPMASAPLGSEYADAWLAESFPVEFGGQPSGLRVIVQQQHADAVAPVLDELGSSLIRVGVLALSLMAAVLAGSWAFAFRVLGYSATRAASGRQSSRSTPTPAPDDRSAGS
ncbi:MAG: protein kinase domain-containing protein [Planctomycetota bacterium]|jgi:hypothetical protein